MDVTKELILEHFNIVDAAVVCAVLEHGEYRRLGTLNSYNALRYLKVVTVSSFCQFTLIFVLMPLVLFVISLVWSALISMTKAVEALSRC